MAASTPQVPGFGRRLFITSSRTNNTEAKQKIARFPQTIPRCLKCPIRQIKGCRRRFEDARSAGMDHPASDVPPGQPMIAKKAVDVAAKIFFYNVWNIAR